MRRATSTCAAIVIVLLTGCIGDTASNNPDANDIDVEDGTSDDDDGTDDGTGGDGTDDGTGGDSTDDDTGGDGTDDDTGGDDDDPSCPADAAPPCVTTPPEALEFDLFAVPGTHFWFDISDAQRRAMNFRLWADGNPRADDDIYTLPDDGVADLDGLDDGSVTYADRLVVGVPGLGGADFGKVEVRLVGTTSRRPLSPDAIPSLRIDSDEFQPELRIGNEEHFRLNSGVRGGILREHVALQLHRSLGYAAPRSTFGFLGTSIHGPTLWLPMSVVEVYRSRFCRRNEALLGSRCTEVWKFDGDLGFDGRSAPAPEYDCVAGTCDQTALQAFGDAIRAAPEGPGLRAALEPLLDWPAYHRFRCLGVAIGSVDDAIRNMGNNSVLLRRSSDGRFVFLPYSLDLSAFGDTRLFGNTELELKCVADPECVAEAQDECLTVADELEALAPEGLVDNAMQVLRDRGMLRSGDEQRGVDLRAYYAARAAAMRAAAEGS